MTEIGLLREAGAVVFTDAHSSVHDSQVLRRLMTYAREFGAVISCETRDKYLGANGVMHEGLLASWLGLSGIPKEAELIPLERDLRPGASPSQNGILGGTPCASSTRRRSRSTRMMR